MKVGKYNVTPKNIASFLRGNTNKLIEENEFVAKVANQLGEFGLKDYEKQQIPLRATLCKDCVEAGECLGECKCETPNLFYDPLKEDSKNKWGRMMSEKEWTGFLNGLEEDISIEEMAEEYRKFYNKMSENTTKGPKVKLRKTSDMPLNSDNNANAVNKVLILPKSFTKQELPDTTMNRHITHTFIIPNTLDVELKIKEVKRDCGCVTPSFTKEIVAPGEEFRVTMRYNAEKSGTYVKRATVKFTGLIEPIVLTITGEVI